MSLFELPTLRFARVNDHLIQLPDDMKAIYGGSGPGAFDWIDYKGWMIMTEDTCEPQTEIYSGAFFVDNVDRDDDGNNSEGEPVSDLLEAVDLDRARANIDAAIAAGAKNPCA